MNYYKMCGKKPDNSRIILTHKGMGQLNRQNIQFDYAEVNHVFELIERL